MGDYCYLDETGVSGTTPEMQTYCATRDSKLVDVETLHEWEAIIPYLNESKFLSLA